MGSNGEDDEDIRQVVNGQLNGSNYQPVNKSTCDRPRRPQVLSTVTGLPVKGKNWRKNYNLWVGGRTRAQQKADHRKQLAIDADDDLVQTVQQFDP